MRRESRRRCLRSAAEAHKRSRKFRLGLDRCRCSKIVQEWYTELRSCNLWAPELLRKHYLRMTDQRDSLRLDNLLRSERTHYLRKIDLQGNQLQDNQ